MAGGSISVRLGVDGAAQAKAALEGFKNDAGAATAQIRASLEALSSGNYGDKFATQLGTAAAKISAAQKALASATASGDTASQVSAQQALTTATAAYGAVLEKRRTQLSPVAAAEAAYAKAVSDATAAEKLGAVSSAEASAARARAQTTYDSTVAKLKDVTTSSAAASASMRGLGIQFVQGISGIATGQPILQTLVQQGHQVVDQSLAMGTGFGGLATSAKGLLSAIGGLPTLIGVGLVAALGTAVAASDSSVGRFNALSTSLRGVSGDYAGLAKGVLDAAEGLSSTTALSFSQAQDSLKTFATSKYFAATSENYARLGHDAVDIAAVMGTSATDAAKLLTNAMADPAKAAEALSSTFSDQLTPQLVRQIQLMQSSGDTSRAFTALLSALEMSAHGSAEQGVSPLQKAWTDLGNSITGSKEAWSPFVSWLSTDFAAALEKTAGLVSNVRSGFEWFKSVTNTDSSNALRANLMTLGTSGTAPGSPSLETILATIANYESGNKNVFNAQGASTASGYYQIINGTWQRYAQQLGLDVGQYPTAISAPIDIQKQVAGAIFQNEGFGPWASNTALISAVQAGNYVAPRAVHSPGLSGSAGGVNTTTAMIDQNYAASVQTQADINSSAAANQEKIGAEIDRVNREIAAQTALYGANSDQVQDLIQTRQKLQSDYNSSITKLDEYNKAQKDQIEAAQGNTEVQQQLSAAIVRARQAYDAAGATFDDAAKNKTIEQFFTLQNQQFALIDEAANQATASAGRLRDAYNTGGDAAANATADQQAYSAALKTFGEDSPLFAGALEQLRQKYELLQRVTDEAAVAQQNMSSRNQIAFIEAETASIGMNEDARGRLLATMQAEQAMHLKFGTILPQEAKDNIELAGRIYDATTAYKTQQGALSELSNFVDNTFSTISDSIVSAFATGQQSAVKFQDVVSSVVQSIESEFLKLAVINPLKNLIFGTSVASSPTLTTVGGVLGQLLGNSGGTISSGASASSNSSGDTLGTAGAALNLASKLGGGSLSLGETVTGWITSLLGDATGSTNAALSALGAGVYGPATAAEVATAGSATDVALQSLGAGVYGPATAGQVASGALASELGLSPAAVSTISSASSTVASAIPYLGAGIGALTQLLNGNYAGAAATAGGAAIGTLIAPGIGTAIGAALGGLVGSLFGGHPKNPYLSVPLVAGADGTVGVGNVVSQVEDPSATDAGAQSFADGINAYMAQVGLKLANIAGSPLGSVGNGITGMTQATSFLDLFKNLQFQDATGDGSNFSIAKGALTGMSFNAPSDLSDELVKIASFADAASAIGIQLKSVSTDLTNIQIANVQGGDASSKTTFTAPDGSNVSYNSDLRTALNNDLQGMTFSNVQALDDEITSVNTFLTQTLPSLLAPQKQTTSSIRDTVDQEFQKYAAAVSEDQRLGLGNTDAIMSGWEKAQQLILQPYINQTTNEQYAFLGRAQTLNLGYAGGGTQYATLAAQQASQQKEQSDLEDEWRQIYGDASIATDAYKSALSSLVAAQDAETQATYRQIQAANDNSYATITASEASYAQRAGLDTLSLELAAYDAKASKERDDFISQWVDYYGQASLQTQQFQDAVLLVDQAHYKERLDLQTTFNQQSDQQLTTAQSSVASLFGSIKDYAVQLQTGSQSPLSPTAQYDLAKSQFNAVSGAAQAGDVTSAQELTNYASTFLSASQAVYGSGAAYATDFQSVLDALTGVSGAGDALTQGFMQQQTTQVTSSVDAVRDAVSSLQDEVAALRREVQNQTRVLAA